MSINEIFVGAKVIHERKIYKVTDLPNYCETGGWWVSISDGSFEKSTLINNVIMPEGLNEEPKEQQVKGYENTKVLPTGEKVVNKIYKELVTAIQKHPNFKYDTAMNAIMEEVGELAQLFNELDDGKIGQDELFEKGFTEAAHVSVTAIRTMELFCKKG